MDFLCDKKIVDNHLHDSSAATSLVQNLFDSMSVSYVKVRAIAFAKI